jgi:AAA domain-containing protein/primase-like protein
LAVLLGHVVEAMRRRGMDEGAILAALKETNKRCKPPLPQRDLERIAASVAGYPSEKEKNEERFELELVTARALCALPDPPDSDQLLGPLLVRGQRLVLGGHTGEGKTTLALALVRAIVLEEAFLDWTGSGGRALVVDAEQGLKTIKRRLREAGLADSELVDYVRVPDGLELDSDERHVAEAERVLEAGRYAVVVADPLYKLHSGDSNAEREAVDLMKRFDRWRETFRFALVLPVHCRKPVPGTKFSIHDLFGSSAYVRGAEVVLGLQRIGDGYARLHFLKDRDGDLPIGAKWGLLFNREDGYRRDPKDAGPPTRERVAELRTEDVTLTQAQVAEMLDLSERTVRKYWREEVADGQESLLGNE